MSSEQTIALLVTSESRAEEPTASWPCLSLIAFVLFIGGMEVGLSYFPFFACLSSEFQMVSSILGFGYSLTW